MKMNDLIEEYKLNFGKSSFLLDFQFVYENNKRNYPVLLFPKLFIDKAFDRKHKNEILAKTAIIDKNCEWKGQIYKPKQPNAPIKPTSPQKPYCSNINIPEYDTRVRNPFLGKFFKNWGWPLGLVVYVLCFGLVLKVSSIFPWTDINDFFGIIFIIIFGLSFFFFPIMFQTSLENYFSEVIRYEYTERERKKMLVDEEQKRNSKLEEYSKAEKKYQIELGEYLKKYEIYRNDCAIYQEQLKEWDIAFNKYKIDAIEEHFNVCLKSIKSAQHQGISGLTTREGSSENSLFLALEKLYPQYIKIDTTLSGYYPDLALWINGVGIDIEIDEPYTFENGTTKEIHYLLDYYGESIDKGRNDSFVSNNWFVLRFAESQIKSNLQECLQIIQSLVKFITSSSDNKRYLKELNNLSSRISTNTWTKERARVMARTNYRMQ